MIKNSETETPHNENQLYFVNKQGNIPFWDHPLVYGYRKLPKTYYPFTSKQEVLQAIKRGNIKEEDMMLLKVLGDAVVANEDQLRRYLSQKMSYSETSKRLHQLRKNGYVERWHCRLENDEDEEICPPAPFTLGVAGFKLMKHYYNECDFMNPDVWDNKDIKAIQRYVAMNELRCKLVESKTIRNWKWNIQIGNHNRYRRPFGMAEVETPKGLITFLIERPQMSQNFLGYLRDTLNQWKSIYENSGNLPIKAKKENPTIVVLYVSTISLADHLHRQLLLDNFPFQVWVCVEELLESNGLDKAFMVPQEEKLQQVMMSFFNPDNGN